MRRLSSYSVAWLKLGRAIFYAVGLFLMRSPARGVKYFFYIIQNVLTQKRYVGICANLERRLQQHSIAENTFLGPGSKTLVRSGEVEGAADLKTEARRE